MRTNIEIDDALMRQAVKASKSPTKTKRAVVEEALQALVRLRAQEDIATLFGKVEFSKGYDYKSLRSASSGDLSGKAIRKDASSRRATSGTRARKHAA